MHPCMALAVSCRDASPLDRTGFKGWHDAYVHNCAGAQLQPHLLPRCSVFLGCLFGDTGSLGLLTSFLPVLC